MRIGIFDSGVGGKAVATKLSELLPHAEIISINDHKNMPYGNRKPNEIIQLTINAIQPLFQAKCDAIIIACNTATTVAISTLRSTYPDMHFIGIEPMIKPAVKLTKTRCIAVCATPSTIKSKRYSELKDTWAKDFKIIEPDCSQWAELIENGESDKIDTNSTVKYLMKKNVDVIVLGCTHYHWIKQRMKNATSPNIKVLEPSDAIAARITTILN